MTAVYPIFDQTQVLIAQINAAYPLPWSHASLLGIDYLKDAAGNTIPINSTTAKAICFFVSIYPSLLNIFASSREQKTIFQAQQTAYPFVQAIEARWAAIYG